MLTSVVSNQNLPLDRVPAGDESGGGGGVVAAGGVATPACGSVRVRPRPRSLLRVVPRERLTQLPELNALLLMMLVTSETVLIVRVGRTL